MKTVLLIVVLGALLAGAVALAARFNPFADLRHSSIHMWIAMGLGSVLSLGLGAGLMALSFHSNARGYDDAASGDD
jgi:ABC-type multidrug transport system permease subunit